MTESTVINIDASTASDAAVDSSGDAAAPDSVDAEMYQLQLATSTDAAIYDTSLNQHLYNIELLLVILVTLVFAYVVHCMFRGMFSKLSGKGK